MPYSARLHTTLHVTHQSGLHWRSLELDTGLDKTLTTANSGLEILDFLCTQTIQRFRGESLVDSEVVANVHVTYALAYKENRLSHSNYVS